MGATSTEDALKKITASSKGKLVVIVRREHDVVTIEREHSRAGAFRNELEAIRLNHDAPGNTVLSITATFQITESQ